MEMKPLVSIAIPVYNCESTIRKTLKSVLSQTFQDFEVLIYDDGSKDDTIRLIDEVQDPRIRVYKDGKNQGIAIRLNQMIDLAKGQYFVRMDGDDLMFPDRLEKQIAYLRDNPEIDVLGAGAIVIDNNDHILGKRGSTSRIWCHDDLFMSSRFIHPTVTGKTEWFKHWKYDEKLSGIEDLDLWNRSFKSSKFADLNDPLLFYRESLNLRLRTYLHRQRLLLGYGWKKRRYMERQKTLFILISKIVLSSVTAIVLNMIGCGKMMVHRRNQILSKSEIEKYNLILNLG